MIYLRLQIKRPEVFRLLERLCARLCCAGALSDCVVEVVFFVILIWYIINLGTWTYSIGSFACMPKRVIIDWLSGVAKEEVSLYFGVRYHSKHNKYCSIGVICRTHSRDCGDICVETLK